MIGTARRSSVTSTSTMATMAAKRQERVPRPSESENCCWIVASPLLDAGTNALWHSFRRKTLTS